MFFKCLYLGILPDVFGRDAQLEGSVPDWEPAWWGDSGDMGKPEGYFRNGIIREWSCLRSLGYWNCNGAKFGEQLFEW